MIAGSEVPQVLPFEIGLDHDIITCGLNSESEPMLDGNPFPTVTWLFNGSTVVNDSKYMINNTSLIVKDINRDDSGLYNCTAVNLLGVETIIYNVKTHGKVTN